MATPTNRFFKTDSTTYETIRETLDEIWGHPNGKALTCLKPAADALQDNDGKIVTAVLGTMLEWPEVEPLIGPLIEGGQITEITEADYRARVPSDDAPAPEPEPEPEQEP